MAYNDSRNPLRALQRKIGSEITVRLKDRTQYVGKLKEYDGYLNIVMTDTKQTKDGQDIGTHSEIFIRGNNVLFVIP